MPEVRAVTTVIRSKMHLLHSRFDLAAGGGKAFSDDRVKLPEVTVSGRAGCPPTTQTQFCRSLVFSNNHFYSRPRMIPLTALKTGLRNI